MRIAVSDAKLALADQQARETAAYAIVGAAERVIPFAARFASLQEISVSIIHAPAKAADSDDAHTGDVLDFRKAQSGRLVHHTT